jgi:hypothetical protein
MGLFQVFGIHIPKVVYGGVTVFFLLWAFYGAWSKEYHARLHSEVREKPSIRVEVREVLTQSRLYKKLKHVADISDPNLGFDVFVKLWIVNEASFPVTVRDYSMCLDIGTSRVRAKRIQGDLHKWRIDETEETVKMWGETRTDHSQREMTPDIEVTSGQSLERGLHREGWLHFLLENTRLSSVEGGTVVVTVEDSLLEKHEGYLKGSPKSPQRRLAKGYLIAFTSHRSIYCPSPEHRRTVPSGVRACRNHMGLKHCRSTLVRVTPVDLRSDDA